MKGGPRQGEPVRIESEGGFILFRSHPKDAQMTQTDKFFDFADAMTRYEADRAAFKAEATRLREANKAALFAVLESHTITQIVVSFDGYGDGGQVENIEAASGGKIVPLPDDDVDLTFARHGRESEARTEPLGEAIESMAYDCLEETHCGWENNDGAYGEFIFRVGDDTITLDYNERYTATESYEHDF